MAFLCGLVAVLLLAFDGALVVAQNNGGVNCLRCASPGLEFQWELTMLPKPKNMLYTYECDTGTSYSSMVPCNQCLTYMFQDPNNVTMTFVVRGCQEEYNRYTTTSAGPNSCEFDDYFYRPNANGKIMRTKILVERCQNALVPCNNRTVFPTTANECSSKNNYTRPVTCHCDLKDTCDSYECSKKYCVKAESVIKSTKYTQKFCIDVNPFGVDEFCSTNKQPLFVSSFNHIDSSNEICFCNDKDYCNAASPSQIALSIVLLVSTALFNFSA